MVVVGVLFAVYPDCFLRCMSKVILMRCSAKCRLRQQDMPWTSLDLFRQLYYYRDFFLMVLRRWINLIRIFVLSPIKMVF